MCRNELYTIIEERGRSYAGVNLAGIVNAGIHICYELHRNFLLLNMMKTNPNKPLPMDFA